MRKRFSKNWLPVSVSILLLAAVARTIVTACGGGFWDEEETSNFAPEVFVDDPYTPFFFTEYYYYYDIDYDTEHDTRFSYDNVQEWTQFIKGGDQARGLVNFILNKATPGAVDSMLAYAQDKTAPLPVMPDTITDKNNLKLLRKKKTRWFLQYAALAHRCEAFAVNGQNYWWYEPRELPAVGELGNIEAQLTAGFQSAKPAFLRQRYLFQLVRYYFFYNQEKAMPLFEQYANSFAKNHTYYRTMAYAAGALHKQEHFAQSNYYYSLVFAGDDKLKTVAHFSFKPQDENDWQQTLALCQSDEEKITCWQMLGTIYEDELRSMKEIYRLNPASPKLALLLVRTVNKMENGEYTMDTLTRRTAMQWIKQLADENKVHNKFLWNTAAGYTAFLTGDIATARTYYTRAAAHQHISEAAADQLHLLVLLADVEALEQIGPAEEARLLPELQWLFRKLPVSPGKIRYSNAHGWVRQTIADIYREHGDIARAECYMHNLVYYEDDKNVEAIRNFLVTDHPKGSYDAFCRSLAGITPRDIDEMKAIRAAFRDDIAAAIPLMRAADQSTELYGNPFNGTIKDCHDCDHAAPQPVKYTKLSFLEKMLEMKTKLKSGQDVYNNALLLGNAFYNMSYYGNARHFSECTLIELGSDPSYISIFPSMFLDNSKAEQYYQTALQHAQTDEQKAKCTFLLAKCERNGWYTRLIYGGNSYNQSHDGDWEEWLDAQIERNQFAKLTQYSNTKYYKEVIAECGYFRTFLAKRAEKK